MTNTAPYPTAPFFVAHKLFTVRFCPQHGTWGDILDGPMTDGEEVAAELIESFHDDLKHGNIPTRDEVRVWKIHPDKPAEDCTAWAIGVMKDYAEERFE